MKCYNIMKIRLKNIPKGYKIENNKLVKIMAQGGTVSNTMQPVPRDKANIEAEKNETVLTDADNDGFYELYNVGGKRHSEGGTPLNLPEQSFIYSDTRKMLLTKEEMKEIGIQSKKRLTPAAASKKFPINKYMEILKDDTSDRIAITSAEAMVKKNKVKLSQIAFIQEKKKNFEDGLPLASYPFLLENGIDPQELEAQIAEQNGQGQGSTGEQPTHQMPDGTVHPGATHEEYMAMQQQGPSQGMPPQQGQPSPEQMQQMMAMQQGAPQGAPQGPPQGGGQEQMMQEVGQALQQGVSPEEVMQQLVQMGMPEEQAVQLIQQIMQSIQGQQAPPSGPPQGGMPPEMMAAMQQNQQGPPPEMMPPQQMMNMGGHPLSKFVYADNTDGYSEFGPYIPPVAIDNTGGMSEFGPILKRRSGGDLSKAQNGFTDNDNNVRENLRGMDQDLKEFCKNNICDYQQWTKAYRLKDTEQIRFMYESYKTKAIDKMKASGLSTEIMPGHENIKPITYQKGMGGPGFGMQYQEGAGGNINVSYEQGGEPLVNSSEPAMMNNMQGNNEIAALTQAQNQLLMERQQIITTVQTNPEKFEDEKSQAELSAYMTQLEKNLQEVSSRLQFINEQQFLSDTTIPLSEFIGETNNPSVANNDQYFNPDLLMAANGTETNTNVVSNDGDPITEPYTSSYTYKCTHGSCTDGHSFGTNIENIDAQYTDGATSGLNQHNNFYNIMGQENFAKVRDAWIQSYRDMEDPNKVSDKTDEELFAAFNELNNLFSQARGAGIEFKDFQGSDYIDQFDNQMKTNAELLGLPVPTREQITMYQGMFNAIALAKHNGSDEIKNLLGQVSIAYSTHGGGSHKIDPDSDLRVTDLDGNAGNNTANEQVGVIDQTNEIVEVQSNPCDAAERLEVMERCAKEGKEFDAPNCKCKEEITSTIPEIPPYLTFPGDDLKVGALASIHRDKKYGLLQNYNPIMRDPGYVDDRAQVAATTALANQAMGSTRNVNETNALAQDEIDKIQANRWATNTKIFDNTQAYNVAAINKAKELNSGYMSDYQDMVNTVDQNFDNTKIADMMNLVDAETTRMDNADKLYELNMRNPNYYFDPQKHSTIFQNPEALEAYRQGNQSGPLTLDQAMQDCMLKYGYKKGSAELTRCATLAVKQNGNTDPYASDITDRNINNNENSDDETIPDDVYKMGGSVPCKSCNNKGAIREKDLIESKMKLRNWIMGI